MGKKEACNKCKLNCSLIHGRKNDPCPVVTTFHKILFGVCVSKDLCLPQKILQTIPVLDAGQDHVLEDTNGQQWQVKLGKKDGRLAFRKGWYKFFADHGLKEGYILAFHYIMDSPFVVQIFDNTGFEKLKFPVANGKKRKRSNVDVNTNAVGECQNLSNHSGISESEPMSKDKCSSLENGNGMYQDLALGDSDIQQVFMINRDAGYKYKEDRSLLLDCMNLEAQLSRVGPDHGSSDKRNSGSSTSAVASILDENPVSAKVVVSGEPPAKVADPTLSNNNNVYLRKENVAEVVNDHHGDHQSADLPTSAKVAAPTLSNNNNVYLNRENITEVANDHHGHHQSVLPRENRAQLHSETRIESSNTTFKRAKIEEAAVSKKHSGEIVNLPKSELMELGKSPSCEFMSTEKYPKFKEPEPVDSLNEERPDASAFSLTVMVGSSELLELPTSVTLGRKNKVVNLKGSDKRVWPVLYQHKLGIKALTSGWKNFFMSYGLQIGDECAFILENEAQTIFRIDVKSK